MTVHPLRPAPDEAPTTLPEPLRYKALAVRLQLENFQQQAELARVTHRLMQLEAAAMKPGLDAVERECLTALHAPEGATFNWFTLTYDRPAPAPG
jgi:hypothetical protein